MLNSKEITIEVTNRCGARCITCPREKFTQKITHMPMPLFKKIIDDAVKNGYKSLDTCGFGDPSCDPLLRERFEYVKSVAPEMLIYVSSNCNMFSQETCQWLGKYIDTLKISCFATTPETYKKVHGLNTFEKSQANIHAILESKTQNKKPYTIGLFLLLPENKHELNDWVAYWEPKLDEVMVWKPHNWTDARNYRDKTATRKSCGRPLNGNLTVGVDGRVSICCFDYNKTICIGDLNHESIAEIKEKSQELKEIAQMHENLSFENSKYLCKDCDQTYDGYSDVLIYSSNPERKTGTVTTHINFETELSDAKKTDVLF